MKQGTYLALDDLRIGLVDDNAYFRRIVRSMLSGLGVRTVIEATSVDQGWQIVALGQVDVLLLDWNLAGGNGVDLLDRIRTAPNDAVATQAIVFLSAHSDRRHVLTAARLGANDFIVKPVSPRLLYDRIRRLTSARITYERRNGRVRPVGGAPAAEPPPPPAQARRGDTAFI